MTPRCLNSWTSFKTSTAAVWVIIEGFDFRNLDGERNVVFDFNLISLQLTQALLPDSLFKFDKNQEARRLKNIMHTKLNSHIYCYFLYCTINK